MLTEMFNGKSVLVTGGTGSFGRAFVNYLLGNSKARRIIIFSRDELKQTQMMKEIHDPEEKLRFFLGDIRDLDRLQRAFAGVDYVVHAAALKHVPVLEYNPFEAIRTNILGTQNIITAAIDQGVRKVVLLSTDKAASPVNLYGATKLCAEKLMVSANVYTGEDTKFGVVRYGNVLGSRGSIVEIIKEQKDKGVVTLTHPKMTRFWITLNQGINLVLLALNSMHGGEIFIPKIPSMGLTDLFKVLAEGAKIDVIGLRPGEKIHETLISKHEAVSTREFEKYFVILPQSKDWPHHIHYHNVRAVPENFCYSSDTNPHFLQKEGLLELLKN